jgi:hypothetical protein
MTGHFCKGVEVLQVACRSAAAGKSANHGRTDPRAVSRDEVLNDADLRHLADVAANDANSFARPCA